MTTGEKIKQIGELLDSIPKEECTYLVLMIAGNQYVKEDEGVLLRQCGDYSDLSAICHIAITDGIRVDNYIKIAIDHAAKSKNAKT